MIIKELRVMRGPNMWSEHYKKLIVIKTEPGSDQKHLEDDCRILEKKLSFIERIKDIREDDPRLRICALLAYAAAWLQPGGENLHVSVHDMAQNTVFAVYGYEEEEVGVEAGYEAAGIIKKILQDEPIDFEKSRQKIGEIYMDYYLGPSTSAIVEAAEKKGIPYRKIGSGRFIVLGQGRFQKKIEASICDTTGSISVDIAGDKQTTKQLLDAARIPVPKGVCIRDEAELPEIAKKLGFPLVTKPLDGHQGKGITANIRDEDALLSGFRAAKKYSRSIIVEKHVQGNDYRFLVIGYKLVAAAHRTPACVKGDGRSSIIELVNEVNKDPMRGEGHEKIMTRITIDEHTLKVLEEKGMTPESVPPKDEVVYLKRTANLSTGGTAIDVTHLVHPDNVILAEKAARVIGLDICGIDIMTRDVASPIAEDGGAILEINAAPGLRMHLAPAKGQPRDVAEPIVNLMYPGESRSRIPIVAITGTNGKTTTARLMAFVAQRQGNHVGFTCTDGIYVDGMQIDHGDCSGPDSARIVLADPLVDFAVLECARGGIIRSGLAFDHCNIGIVTNVAADHLGLKDIHTEDDLARVKAMIPKSVAPNNYAILNAADDRVYKMKEGLLCHVALFALDQHHPRIVKHCREGGLAAALNENREIIVIDGDRHTVISHVENIPITMGGKASFMIENVLPVVLSAYVSGFNIDLLRTSLAEFKPSAENTPGRLNQFEVNGVHVLIDYAHNPHGLRAMGKFLDQIDAYKTGVVAGTGDRRDDDIVEMGKVAASIYNEVVIRVDRDKRDRTDEEMAALILQGLKEVKPDIPYKMIPEEKKAVAWAIDHARKGDYVVIGTENIKETIELVKTLQANKPI